MLPDIPGPSEKICLLIIGGCFGFLIGGMAFMAMMTWDTCKFILAE